jgi:hypothetical protein
LYVPPFALRAEDAQLLHQMRLVHKLGAIVGLLTQIGDVDLHARVGWRNHRHAGRHAD